MRAECRFGHIVRVHAHLMIATAEINLGEEAGAFQFINELIHQGIWKFVPHRLHVQLTVVDAEAPCLVRLAHEEDWGREQGGTPE